jgi:predicted extracellular nuclease
MQHPPPTEKPTRSHGIRAIAAASLLCAASAHANIEITEWAYSAAGGDFIEFASLGALPVDFSSWVYDDELRFSSAAAGGFDLSGFGLVAAGESVVLTESVAATFRAAWDLDASVKVLGGFTNNLGRNDEINLFDASGALVDRLRFGDSSYAPGTIRTQNVSGNPGTLAALTPTTVTTGWMLSAAGDVMGSVVSAGGDIGNPGAFALSPVPETGTLALWLAGLAAMVGVARRRAATPGTAAGAA